MNRLFLALAAALAASIGSAHAQLCPGYTLNIEQVAGDTYDPVDVVPTRVQVRLSVDGGTAPAACALQPVIVSADFDTDPLATVFRNPDSLLNLTGSYPGNADANLVGFTARLTLGARQRLVSGEPITLSLVDLTAGQFLRAGTYTSPIRARVGIGGTPVTLNLVSQVVPAMQLLASSADGQETIDLGDPRNGTSGSTLFFFRSNMGVQVAASSLNGGRLLHEGSTGHTIPYTMNLASTPLNLSAGPAQVNIPFTSILPRASLIEVNVPPPPANDQPFAGVYRDTVTLSFTPF